MPTGQRDQQVTEFLARHVKPSPGKTAEGVKDRIERWLQIANDPSTVTTDTTPKAIANIRRKARQNISRLVQRHPHVAAVIDDAAAESEVRR